MPSNRVPLPLPGEDTTLYTLQRLESLFIHDSVAAAQLAKIEAEADKFRQARNRIQEQIFRYKATIAPIRGLPLEVLAHIFSFLAISSPDTIARASLVCQAWRAATMFPRLWSNVVVAKEMLYDEKKVKLFIRRSGQTALAITYHQSTPHHWHWNAWSALMLSTHRWRSLSVHFDDHTVASSRIRSLGEAPCLAELSIVIRRQCQNPRHEGKLGFELDAGHLDANLATRFSRLRSLSLWTFVMPAPGPLLGTLTKLHITDTYSELENPKNITPIQALNVLALLSHCHSVEDFSFDAEQTYRWFVRTGQAIGVEGPVLPLPRLRRLNLHCHYSTGQAILEHLTAEGLECATLYMRPRFAVQQSDEVCLAAAQFVIRSPGLRSLHILGLRMGVVLAGSIRAFRHLEELHLEHVPGLETIVERFSEKQRTAIFPEPIWFSPQLSSLTIDAESFDVPYEKLAKLVKARFSSNIPHGTPNRINKLVINKQDMLKGLPPGEMAKFERPRRFQTPCNSKPT